jgi:hypothetical protein
MHPKISHDREEENLLAKARWFQTLTFTERADLLCQFTDLILEVNPKVIERKNVKPIEGRIRIVTKA